MMLPGWQLNRDDTYRGVQFLGATSATGYCLAIEVGRHLHSEHIRSLLRQLITRYGTPRAIRTDDAGAVAFRGKVMGRRGRLLEQRTKDLLNVRRLIVLQHVVVETLLAQ